MTADREPIVVPRRTRVRVHANECQYAEGRLQLPSPIGVPRRPPDGAVLMESSVLGAFRRGDPAAVREFYRAYGRLVYGVAYRVLGRADLAEEATQRWPA